MVMEDLKIALNQRRGYISTEMDLWSDSRLRSYMGITARMVSKEFKISTHLMSFEQLSGCHTGVNIADCFQRCLKSYDLTVVDIVR